MSERVTAEGLMVNVLYILSQAMDLIARDVDRRMRLRGGGLKREKKMLFGRYTETVRMACSLAERIGDDIIAAEAGKGFRDYDVWLGEANELARLVLLFADKASEEGVSEAVFSYLSSFKGEGVVTDDVLGRFFLG